MKTGYIAPSEIDKIFFDSTLFIFLGYKMNNIIRDFIKNKKIVYKVNIIGNFRKGDFLTLKSDGIFYGWNNEKF